MHIHNDPRSKQSHLRSWQNYLRKQLNRFYTKHPSDSTHPVIMPISIPRLASAGVAVPEKSKPDLSWLDEYDKVARKFYIQLAEHYGNKEFSLEESYRDVPLLMKLKGADKEYRKFCIWRTNNCSGAGQCNFFWDQKRWSKLFLRLTVMKLLLYMDTYPSPIFDRQLSYFTVDLSRLDEIRGQIFIDAI